MCEGDLWIVLIMFQCYITFLVYISLFSVDHVCESLEIESALSKFFQTS